MTERLKQIVHIYHNIFPLKGHTDILYVKEGLLRF